MENEILEIYEHNDQTIELSLVAEEEIPEALEVVRVAYENTKHKRLRVFRLESDEKMRSYMTDKGFAVKAMRYGEMVAVFIVQTEGVDKILAETGLELSEEERKSAALIYSWYPMLSVKTGPGVPLRLINRLMRAAEKVMWDRGIHYAAGIEVSGVGRAMGTFGRSYYKEKGDFQKENGEMQTLFWKDLKKVESHSVDGDDEWLRFYIEQAEEQEGPEVYDFMQRIYEGIPDKSWFSLDNEEKILRYVATSGFALKAEAYLGGSKYELAGIFIARTSELGEENLGKYLNLNEEELTRVAHMEIAMVDEKFRGKGLQKSMMEVAEEHLKFLGYHWLMGTAHPENVYSVNNFRKLGYEIVAEDLKYGGLPRYIFCKKI